MNQNGRINVAFSLSLLVARLLASSQVILSSAMKFQEIWSIFLLCLPQFVFSSEYDTNWNFTHKFPLRIPPEIQTIFPGVNDNNFRPKRSEESRQGKQLVPGVYSCGHQVHNLKQYG